MQIKVAQAHEFYTVLELVEELFMELEDEGQDLSGIDREKLHADIRKNLDSETGSPAGPGRLLAVLARDDGGLAVGVLLLSQSFALHAGGEYGVIDEVYVRPEYRRLDIARQLLDEAVAIATRRGWLRLDVAGPEGERGDRAARFSRELGL